MIRAHVHIWPVVEMVYGEQCLQLQLLFITQFPTFYVCELVYTVIPLLFIPFFLFHLELEFYISQEYHGSRKNRVLIFVLYKKEAARIESNLQRAGWSCTSIHGDKSQDAR
jgi:hypothetical protein